MKKILAAILAASLALTLVACGAPAEQTGDEWQLRREKLTQEEVEQAPTEDQLVVLDTACGQIQGIQKDGYQEFRGVRYATAERWEQAEPVTSWEGIYDATVWGDGSCQYRGFYHARLEKENAKLQAKFDTVSRQLQAASQQHEDAFGEGDILSVRDLKMYFSGIKAVDGLSFNIKQGEIFGLIGPNGAGKTTVFNCITQFYKPTAGEVLYRDRYDNVVPLTTYKTTEVIKAGISRTFQNLELVYWLPIMDNMLIGAHAFYRSTLGDQFIHTAKLRREEDVFRQRALSILERLGIAQYKDMPPMGLPYGVLKKVELARTLMSNPRMIILDEPAAGLNDAETEELTEIIRLIRDDFHCTIFLVEHDMNLVMTVCDTVCAISFGKMLAIGTPEEIQNSPQVQEAYLGTE